MTIKSLRRTIVAWILLAFVSGAPGMDGYVLLAQEEANLTPGPAESLGDPLVVREIPFVEQPLAVQVGASESSAHDALRFAERSVVETKHLAPIPTAVIGFGGSAAAAVVAKESPAPLPLSLTPSGAEATVQPAPARADIFQPGGTGALFEHLKQLEGSEAQIRERARNFFDGFKKSDKQYDVIVVGSGPGGATAAAAAAHAGLKVLVLEQGQDFTYPKNKAGVENPPGVGAHAFWNPDMGLFGHHHFWLLPPGKILFWGGVGLGGGTLAWAGTLFPLTLNEIRKRLPEVNPQAMLKHYYPYLKYVFQATPTPDRPPHNVPKFEYMKQIGESLAAKFPGLVLHGPLHTVDHKAPTLELQGAEFKDIHRNDVRWGPIKDDTAMETGDWGTRTSAYGALLAEPEKAGKLEIRTLHQAEKLEPLPDGGYRITGSDLSGLVGKTGPAKEFSLTADRVVMALGPIRTAEFFLKQRDVHHTMPDVPKEVGQGIYNNGDRLGLAIPSKPAEPDKGRTNMYYVQFLDEHGEPKVLIIDGGFPKISTMLDLAALDAAGFRGVKVNENVIDFNRWVAQYFPGISSLPLVLLGMNARSRADGVVTLGEDGRARLDVDTTVDEAANKEMDAFFALMARSIMPTDSFKKWEAELFIKMVPKLYQMFKILTSPHIHGGMRKAVDLHTGELRGYPGARIGDLSLVPGTLGVNPTLTGMGQVEHHNTYFFHPEHQKLILESVLRILKPIAPGKIIFKDMIEELARRVEEERRVNLLSQITTGILKRPHGKLWWKLLEDIDIMLREAAKEGVLFSAGLTLPQFVNLYAQHLTVEILNLTPAALEEITLNTVTPEGPHNDPNNPAR